MASVDTVRDAICMVCSSLIPQAERFRELDAQVGDGDLGVTLSRGCSSVLSVLADSEPESIGALLTLSGQLFLDNNASTLSNLLGEGCRAAGEDLMSSDEVSLSDWVAALDRAIRRIQKRGGAELGDKTIVDALAGSLARLTQADEARMGARAAASALREGAERATAELVDKEALIGRAAWQGARTIGIPDPGATVWVEVTRAIEAYVTG